MPSSMEPPAVHQAVQKMTSASSISAVAAATGVSVPTVTAISKGEGKIRQKTADAIMKVYEAWKAGTVELAAGRKKREAAAPPKPKAITIDKKALQVELEQLEKKVEAIRALLKLY
jgi:hypothetical protein